MEAVSVIKKVQELLAAERFDTAAQHQANMDRDLATQLHGHKMAVEREKRITHLMHVQVCTPYTH